MSDELRAAANRIIAATITGTTFGNAGDAIAAKSLADAYLAEHPDDEDASPNPLETLLAELEALAAEWDTEEWPDCAIEFRQLIAKWRANQ